MAPNPGRSAKVDLVHLLSQNQSSSLSTRARLTTTPSLLCVSHFKEAHNDLSGRTSLPTWTYLRLQVDEAPCRMRTPTVN